VLRFLAVALAAVAVGGAAPGRFENDVYGYSLVVPTGWTARLSEDGTTNIASYRGAQLDRLGQPPAGQVRVIVADVGRGQCAPGKSRETPPTSLGERTSFEGFLGHSVSLCLRGHSFQALVPVGPGASAARLEEARQIVASVQLTPRAREVDIRHSVRMLGRSVEGRPIRAWRIGTPAAKKRVLVVGCIHGDECAGLAVTARLVNLARPIDVDLWVVQQLNPDGYARRSRLNARGVDLNRDFLAATQRETRIARTLIRRLKPDVTLWYHQPQAVVRAWGPSRAVARRYARLAGVPYRTWEWPPGSAPRWQNVTGQRSFVVELPPGELSNEVALRHAKAVLRLSE